MKAKEWFKSKIEEFKDDFEFRLEGLILDLTEEISKKMEQKKISKIELAKLLNVKPSYITKILRGYPNFTIKTLLSIADALNQELEINFKEKGTIVTQRFVKEDTQFISSFTEDFTEKFNTSSAAVSIPHMREQHHFFYDKAA